jgi:hypothetical protein
VPALRALAHADLEADEFLLAVRRRADQHQRAFAVVFHASLQEDAVRPHVLYAPSKVDTVPYYRWAVMTGGSKQDGLICARMQKTVVGMIGSGGMARTYLDAFCQVRTIKKVKQQKTNAASVGTGIAIALN